MTPETPTDPAPSAAEVKERLKELNEIVGDYDFRMSYGTEHGQTIASAIALIERGELERERLDKKRLEAAAKCEEVRTENDDLRAQLAAATERVKQIEAQYYELLYGVATVWPNETRHQTAKRYIHERENRASDPVCDAARAQPTPESK